MIRRIHHVAVVVKRLTDAYRFYRDVLGLPLVREAEIPDQGVRAALLGAGDTEIELIEPLGSHTGVARFLERRGEGLHHVCFETRDVPGALADVRARGAELLDAKPRPGLAGQIAFLHPRACAGILVELATPPENHEPSRPAPLRFKRVVLGAADPAKMSASFQSLFGLSEVMLNSGPRSMLALGRGALLIVPAGEVGGAEGLVALSLVSDSFQDLGRALDRAHARALRGTGEITVEPASTHGVHLHISRYE